MRTATTIAIVTVSMVFFMTPQASADGLAVGVPHESIGTVFDGGAANVIYGTADGLTVTGSQMWNQDTAGIPGMSEDSDQFGLALISGDFDGNGRGDLAIGVPKESIGDAEDAGLVHVLYADGAGVLTADGTQWWYQGLNDLIGTPDSGDEFGGSLAAGDFNGDGFDDLAIAAAGEDVGGETEAGAVHIIYGSASGLISTGNQVWNQASPGIHGVAEGGDHFAETLAVGDFDGDGIDDLAIGSPFEELGGIDGAGTVHVLYGSPSGITSDDNYFWSDPWVVQEFANFGSSLAAGDLNGDGRDDLAIGAPDMTIWGEAYAGTATVLYGSEIGLSTLGFQTLAQGADCQGFSIQDTYESSDRFGYALAIGDFDGDDRDDLAISAPGESIGSTDLAGVVHILFSNATGLTGEDNQLWHQGLSSVGWYVEYGDRFGKSLAAGDFNEDGTDDLAVGVPFESFNSLSAAGLVHIFYGGSGGPSSGLEVWSQDGDVPGEPEDYECFGTSLAAIKSLSRQVFADGFESGNMTAWSLAID